ncbi:MAG: glycosyltransferase family 2 protein, partial [Acidimicrobiales bacterium]
MEVQAPPVVAVVVTRDPGPWLEGCLAALGGQDYPNLAVVVVDAGSTIDPADRVRAVLPGATVHRLHRPTGFGPAANVARELVGQTTHLLVCHDDVAPAKDALRQMVEESFRSNAGIVAPKLVAWNAPDRLLQVGLGMDKGGVPVAKVERGELDQEQHDAVRDVFVAPGGFCLVRSDLFETLGGFDPAMDMVGEDTDLCWRAQLLGARVVVTPAAKVRHVEATSSGLANGSDPDPRVREARQEVLARRHELRSVLKAYGPWRLARIIPYLALLSLVEMVVALASGHPERARAIGGAWWWNCRRAGELRAERAALQPRRRVPDRALHRLQARGSARMATWRRSLLSAEGRAGAGARQLELGQLGPSAMPHDAGVAGPVGPVGPAAAIPAALPGGATSHAFTWAGASAGAAADGVDGLDGVDGHNGPPGPGTLTREGRPATTRTAAVVAWVVVLAVMAVGSRQLLGSSFPRIGQLQAWPAWATFLHHYASGWRATGLGAAAPAPLAFALLGVAGAVVFGHMGFLQHVA